MRITLTTLSRPEDGSHFRLLEAGKIRRGREIGCSSKSTYLFVHQDDSLGEVNKVALNTGYSGKIIMPLPQVNLKTWCKGGICIRNTKHEILY